MTGLLVDGYLAGVAASVVAIVLRLAGFAVGIPALAGAAVPFRVRAMLFLHVAVVLSAANGFRPAEYARADEAMVWVLALAGEFLLGLALGMIVRVVFAGAEAFGHIASYSLGLGFAMQVDPATGTQTTVLARIALLVAGMVMFVIDVHLKMFEVAMRSFEVFAVGGAPRVDELGMRVARAGAQIFDIGFQLAGPVVAIGLMVYLVLAVVTKVSPQLNLFAIGFSLILLAGLSTLMVSVPDVVEILGSRLAEVPSQMSDVLRGAAR